jgi:ribose-phosphate pyrophosphokinase
MTLIRSNRHAAQGFGTLVGEWLGPKGHLRKLRKRTIAKSARMTEVHDPAAFENAFRCRIVTLTDARLFVDYIRRLGDEDLCVVSPDTGGAKRAKLLRETLEAACGRPVAKAFADKHRSAGVVSGDLFVGDVAGRTAVIVDDLISTGGTLLRAARAARKAGARRV